MQHSLFIRMVTFIVGFLTLTSCNIYRAFDTANSEEANLEEALRCYHDKDYNCAVAAYEKLPNGDTKTEKLCTAYLSQAGLTLDLLLGKVNKSGATMLGELGTALIPWTETRGTAASKAAKNCDEYADAKANSTTTLLSSVAQLIDCATRLARADQFGDGGTSCTTPRTQASDSKVTDSDVDFMCDEDAKGCATSISKITANQLSNAGLSALKSAFDQFPNALTNENSTAAIVRLALKTVVGDSR